MKARAEIHFVGTVSKAGEQEAEVSIFPDFCDGLRSISGFSHLIIIYWMHLRNNERDRATLLVFPKKHQVEVKTGVFACRSPSRPNPIGLCVVKVLKVEGCILTVKELDAAKGSPIIDIKPYIPKADSVPNARVPDWTKHGPST